MPKPVAEWTEDDVLALPSGENNTFERKGARLLDLRISGVSENDVLNELAKQLSAFANTGGGQIVYGVTDTGAIDNGGIARVAKGKQSTKEWLEDVVPVLTDFEIVGFNVYEILPKASGSNIAADKSLYVVDVPDSDRAPHQSKRDHKYYVRLGGKSHPAPHRLIEDIRNRPRYPKIVIQNPRIVNVSYIQNGPAPTQGQLHIVLELGIRNANRVRAANTALLFAGNIPLNVGSHGGLEFFVRGGSKHGTGLIEVKNIIYPGMDISTAVLLVTSASIQPPTLDLLEGRLPVGGLESKDVIITVTSFADSAPPNTQEFQLAASDTDSRLSTVLGDAVRRLR